MGQPGRAPESSDGGEQMGPSAGIPALTQSLWISNGSALAARTTCFALEAMAVGTEVLKRAVAANRTALASTTLPENFTKTTEPADEAAVSANLGQRPGGPDTWDQLSRAWANKMEIPELLLKQTPPPRRLGNRNSRSELRQGGHGTR